jgi:hypothetical protein
MTDDELRSALSDLGITQQDFSRLAGVTSRAVSLWVTDERQIPGPAEAYLRLLLSLPKTAQLKELARLSKKDQQMYEGMYLINYQGQTGGGYAVLILSGGIAFGSDTQVRYDGTYEPNAVNPKLLDLNLNCTVPAGVGLVQGVPPQPADYWFPLKLTFPPREAKKLGVKTPYGEVAVEIRFLREVPAMRAA